MQSDSYIDIMIQSLKQKVRVLDLIITKNNAQQFLFEDPNLEPDVLEQNMEEKAKLIDKLNMLDDGFQQTYDRIHDEIDQNRAEHKQEIKQMQELIRQITDKSNSIRIQEQKNKALAMEHFAKVKKQIRQVKTSYNQVNQYYKNMMN